MLPQVGVLLTSGSAVVDWLRTKRCEFGEKLTGAFRDLVREPDHEGTLGFLHLVESDIREVLDLGASPKSPLVIFVDDLDRCAPHKVAEVVQAINLFLSGDYPTCIFVLGMEPGVVAAALEVANKDVIAKVGEYALLNGHAPLGWRFMEKIIQLPLAIRAPDPTGTKAFLAHLTGSSEAGPTGAPVTIQMETQERSRVRLLGGSAGGEHESSAVREVGN